MLKDYFLSNKRGRLKNLIDRRKKRVIPHQTDVNKILRRIGLKNAKNVFQKYLDAQIKDALELNEIKKTSFSKKIDFIEQDIL